jgi:hypothetical protein
MRRSIGASMTKGAVRASHRRPAMKVCVFQCPNGTSKAAFAPSSCGLAGAPPWWSFRSRPERPAGAAQAAWSASASRSRSLPLHHNPRRRLLPPSGIAPLGSWFRPPVRRLMGRNRLSRGELSSVSQHRVHDDCEAASQGDARLGHNDSYRLRDLTRYSGWARNRRESLAASRE